MWSLLRTRINLTPAWFCACLVMCHFTIYTCWLWVRNNHAINQINRRFKLGTSRSTDAGAIQWQMLNGLSYHKRCKINKGVLLFLHRRSHQNNNCYDDNYLSCPKFFHSQLLSYSIALYYISWLLLPLCSNSCLSFMLFVFTCCPCWNFDNNEHCSLCMSYIKLFVAII